MLTPGNHWVWYFDDKKDRMALDLGDNHQFTSQFCGKKLKDDAFIRQGFFLCDIEMYHQINEISRTFGLDDSHCFELTLSTLIMLHFAKPTLLKSWLFTPISRDFQPKFGDTVIAVSAQTNEQAPFLVIEATPQSSVCLLMGETLNLREKTLIFAEPIKMMNDRLLPVQKNERPTISIETY